MSKVFKTRRFNRWMRKTELSDAGLLNAVTEMEQGLIDADLGGGIVKKRIALPGRGKRGSVRTLIATNKHDRWFFVFGFEKKDLENVSAATLQELQAYSGALLSQSPQALNTLVQAMILEEIHHES